MASKRFYFLLLFSVVWCDASKSAHNCWKKGVLSREEKCATQDVIWGWLNVVNQPALRAEAVKRNVSEVMQKAREVRGKADAAIAEYKKILVSLDATSNRKEIDVVDQAIADVNKSIERVNQSEQRANEATKAAEESIISSTVCFSAIMRVSCYLWGVSPDGSWNYTSVKAIFDAHSNDCENKYNISKILNTSTENIDTVNLTEWKDKALQVLNKTYNDIKLNTKKYHWSLTNGNEKIGDVQKTIVEAVGRLEVSVKNFELCRVAVSDAVKKVNSASSVVEAANNSVLASANVKMFCEIVGQLSRSKEKLRTTGKKMTDATQSAVDAVTISKRVQAEVTIADELIKEVGVWLRGSNLALVHKLSGTHGVAKASNAMSTSVRTASKAVSIVNEIEQKMKTERELIKFVETQLANMSSVTGASISDVEFDVCNSRVSEILKKESSEVIRSIAKFNTTVLTRLNASLHKIDGKADAIGHKLLDVSKQVQEAKSSGQNVSLLAKRATENVREAIIEVLSGGVAELCAVLSKFRALHNEAGAFSVHAAHAQANISEWLVRVDAAAKESDGFDDLSGSVEGAFATAGKRLEVLKRVLYRADEQRAKVVGELAASVAVKESDEHGPQINKTLHDVFANVASREAKTFSKDACNASLMTQSLKLLSNMTDHTAVMNSLQVVAQLNRLTESMKERVLKAHNLMRMATESSAQADAALEEAIRMARERSGKPQCPALYRQLLGALGLHW